MPARAFHAVPGGIYASFHLTGLQLSTTGVFWIVGCKSPAALPTLADVTAVANACAAWLTGEGSPKTLISNTATCDYIRAWSQAEEGGPEVTLFVEFPFTSNANDNSTEAALVEFETGIHARGVNGRLFFGPIDGSEPGSDGLLSTVYVNAVAVSVANLGGLLNAAGYQASVISQKYGICRPWLDARVGRAVAIQSRRMAGRD